MRMPHEAMVERVRLRVRIAQRVIDGLAAQPARSAALLALISELRLDLAVVPIGSAVVVRHGASISDMTMAPRCERGAKWAESSVI